MNIRVLSLRLFLHVRSPSFLVPFILCVAAAIVYSAVVDKQYSSTAMLIPVNADRSSGALSQLASRLGGLGGLVPSGMTLRTDSHQRNLQILKSRKVAELFIQDIDLLPYLFGERWDDENSTWLPKKGAIFGILQASDPDAPPSMWYAFKRIQDRRTIVNDELSNTVRVTYHFEDPVVAQYVTAQFVDFVNEYIRNLDKVAVEQNLKFVTERLQQTRIAAVAEALGRVAQDQLEKRMFVQVRDEYAYEIVDPPVVPEEPSRPRILLALALGLSTGLFAGIFLTIFLATYRQSDSE